MYRSPWAKFTDRNVAHTSENPTAISAYTAPIVSPLTRNWMRSSIRDHLVGRATRGSPAPPGSRVGRRRASKDPPGAPAPPSHCSSAGIHLELAGLNGNDVQRRERPIALLVELD